MKSNGKTTKREVLATVGIVKNASCNDALRHWLLGNGYEWKYDSIGRLTFTLSTGRYRAEFKYLGDDALRIYAIPA